MNDSPPTDYRFGEKAFRRYEPFITRIVWAYPKSIIITQSEIRLIGLSVETVRGRLRDALDSFKENKWLTSSVDTEKWEKINPKDIKVRIKIDGTILAGKELNLIKSTEELDAVLIPPAKVFNCAADLCKVLIVELCENKAIPSGVLVSGFFPADADYFSERFDVTFTEQPNQTYLLK